MKLAKKALLESNILYNKAGLERETAEIKNRLGVLYRRMGDFKTAEAAILKAAEREPDAAELLPLPGAARWRLPDRAGDDQGVMTEPASRSSPVLRYTWWSPLRVTMTCSSSLTRWCQSPRRLSLWMV